MTTGRENWLHFLALARLEKTQQDMLAGIEDPEGRRQYQAQLDQFAKKFEKSRPQLAERQALLAPLQAKLGRDSLAPEAKRALLEQVLKIDPADGNLLVEMIFYCTMREDWDLALEYAVGAITVSIGWSGYVVSFLRDFGLRFYYVCYLMFKFTIL